LTSGDLTGGAVSVDDHEFGAFFVSHYGRLYALGVLLTGDRGQAEELAQDALVRTYRRWALVGPPDDPASFARRVLINRHRSLLRRSRSRRAKRWLQGPQDGCASPPGVRNQPDAA
jgi:DNA-directed RNA polymerase specialized sigma24 family protein